MNTQREFDRRVKTLTKSAGWKRLCLIQPEFLELQRYCYNVRARWRARRPSEDLNNFWRYGSNCIEPRVDALVGEGLERVPPCTCPADEAYLRSHKAHATASRVLYGILDISGAGPLWNPPDRSESW